MRFFNMQFFRIVTTVIIAAILLHPVTVFAWGDNGGMRPSYSVQEINEKADTFGNTPFFNSIEIKDSDYAWYQDNFGEELAKGNLRYEKNFVGARENTGVNAGKNNIWNGNNIDAEDGKIYLVRIYAHNNNPNGWDGVSEDTKVYFTDANNVASTLETVKLEDENGYETGETKQMQRVQINGFISSSNANPSEYWDFINFNSDTPFHLEYIQNSALLENNGIGKGGFILDNDIIDAKNGGTLIGYDALDGRIPGGYEYASYITIQVKVVYDYDFTIEKKVRLVGEKEWNDAIEANIGDEVELQIKYVNNSDYEQKNVLVKDIIQSDNLVYVKGSAKIENATYPNGKTIDDDLVGDGISIGNYKSGETACIIYRATITDENLTNGSNTLVNWTQAQIGSTIAQDYAAVVLYKNAALFHTLVTILLVLIVFCLIIILALTLYKIYIKRHL